MSLRRDILLHDAAGLPPLQLTPRYNREYDQAGLDALFVAIIAEYAGRPCPTRSTLTERTGMPRRRIWSYLVGMQARGLIELEVRYCHDVGKDPKRRRLRVVGGAWTDWTARRPHDRQERGARASRSP